MPKRITHHSYQIFIVLENVFALFYLQFLKTKKTLIISSYYCLLKSIINEMREH